MFLVYVFFFPPVFQCAKTDHFRTTHSCSGEKTIQFSLMNSFVQRPGESLLMAAVNSVTTMVFTVV